MVIKICAILFPTVHEYLHFCGNFAPEWNPELGIWRCVHSWGCLVHFVGSCLSTGHPSCGKKKKKKKKNKDKNPVHASSYWHGKKTHKAHLHATNTGTCRPKPWQTHQFNTAKTTFLLGLCSSNKKGLNKKWFEAGQEILPHPIQRHEPKKHQANYQPLLMSPPPLPNDSQQHSSERLGICDQFLVRCFSVADAFCEGNRCTNLPVTSKLNQPKHCRGMMSWQRVKTWGHTYNFLDVTPVKNRQFSTFFVRILCCRSRNRSEKGRQMNGFLCCQNLEFSWGFDNRTSLFFNAQR